MTSSLENTSSKSANKNTLTHTTLSASQKSLAPMKAINNTAIKSEKNILASIDDDDKPALTAQSLLERQFYISSLMKIIRSNVRYPARAIEEGQSGSLRITLVINRVENIESTKIVAGSRYGLLNEGALYAIKKSEPLPPIPEKLTGTTLELTVPITFVTSY